jgi:hypothetical protein
MSYLCHACGYPGLSEKPRTPDGGGSYEICPSCGYEYGVTDDDLGISVEQWREEWIRKGMPWDKKDSAPPTGWDPTTQLRKLSGK